MKTKKSGLLITTLFLLWGCMEVDTNPSLPKWELEIDAPIVKLVVKSEDIIPEDSLVYKEAVEGEDGLQYVYKDTVDIDEQEVGDQLSLDEITPQRISQSVDDVTAEGTDKHFKSEFDTVGVNPITNSTRSEVGIITLEDTDPAVTPNITMTDIYPTLPADGQNYTIPQGTDFSSIDRNIEFTDFSSATVVNGEMEIKIVNHLATELGFPTHVELLTRTGSIIGSGLDATWESGIMPGDSSSRIIDLAGYTLPGELLVRVSGKIAGSGDATGVVDESVRNSFFVVKSQARNLEVSQASAIIPEQVIDTTSSMALNAEEKNKIETAVIDKGNLSITIENTSLVNATVTFQVPSLDITPTQQGVQPFVQSFMAPANQTKKVVYDISEMAIIMDLSDQTVYYSYEIRTVDTSPEKILLHKEDDFLVDVEMYGVNSSEKITFKHITGIIEPQDIAENGEIDIISDSEIFKALISRGSITINVDNQINTTDEGLPHLILDLPDFFNLGGSPIHEERDLVPGITTIEIPLINHTLVPRNRDSGTNPDQYVIYEAKVTTQEGENGSYNVKDSIRTYIHVSELKFLEVTGKFSQDAIVTDSVMVIDDPNKLDEALLEAGTLNLTFFNNIGVVADVAFRIPALNKNGQMFHESFHLTDQVAPQQFQLPLHGYTLDLDYNGPTVDQDIAYRSTISLPEDVVMTLSFDKEILVDIALEDMRFTEVSGYIDTVIVDINPLEQSITTLPEELKNIEFSEVTMQLVFDSEIDVPVYLDLNITSKNDAGDSVTIKINQDITENPVVDIPNSKELVNIMPNKIKASGEARIVGEGSVRKSDTVKGKLFISVPFAFEISDSAFVDLEITELDTVDMPAEVTINQAVVNAKVDNGFKLGAEVTVLGSPDSSYLEISNHPDVIEIAHITVNPNDTSQVVVSMDDEVLDLLMNGGYVKPNIRLLGPEDGTTTRVLSTDSLTVWIYGTIKALIDIEGEEEEK